MTVGQPASQLGERLHAAPVIPGSERQRLHRYGLHEQFASALWGVMALSITMTMAVTFKLELVRLAILVEPMQGSAACSGSKHRLWALA